MAIFCSKLFVYQRVMIVPFSHWNAGNEDMKTQWNLEFPSNFLDKPADFLVLGEMG